MFIIFINLSAQHKIYKFNNDCLNVFIDGEDEYNVFYKTDTISSSKVKHISKHHIALIIDKNGELKLFNPKYTFRINTELALLINDARSGFSGSENK